MKIELYQVDAFTEKIFSGNPAGVVVNADRLSDELMQKIAREMNLSETAFIINKESDDYDIEVRFFTPVNEVPICGHATIAAHFVYAGLQGIRSGVIRQKTKAGILPVEISEEDGDISVSMTQAAVVFGDLLNSERKKSLLEGLGIEAADLEEDLPLQIVSTGHSKVMIPVKSRECLDGITIRANLLSTLSSDIGCNGFYVFTFDSGEEGVLTSGRMFAPAIGINEDPVTGNANGPLGAYLARYGILDKKENPCCFRIKQGEAAGRTGYMDVRVYCNSGEPELVTITGKARTVFRTELDIDEESL